MHNNTKEILSPGLHSSIVFNEMGRQFQALDEEKKAKLLSQVNGVFEFHIKKCSSGKEQIYTVDLKKDGSVIKGKSSSKPDTVIVIADDDFVSLAKGRLNGQKAFMLGKIKIKGQMMLTVKLDTVFKQLAGKSKL